MFGNPGKIVYGSGLRNSSVSAEVAAHLSAITDQSGGLGAALTTLIDGLIFDNLWLRIRAICVQHNNETDSLVDLKGTQNSIKDVTNPGVWSSTGWALGNNQTQSINTQVIGNSSGGLIAVNDNHLMCYVSSSIGSDGFMIGSADSANDGIAMGYGELGIPVGDVGYLGGGLLATDPDFANITVATPTGMFIGSLLSGTSRMRHNATVDSTTAGTIYSIGTGPIPIKVGASSDPVAGTNMTTTETYTAWASGGGLTATEMTNYHSRISTFMTTMGWN